MDENGAPKVKTSRLAIGALVCITVALFMAWVLNEVAVRIESERLAVAVGSIGEVLLRSSLVATSLLGIAAMIAVARSDGRLKGAGLGGMAVAVSVVMTILMVVPGAVPYPLAYQMLCGTNLKGLGNALLVYANDNNGELPDAARWCDLLITKADVSPSSLVCKESDTVRGESSYAMNIAAAGKKLSELPKDMVLIFEVRPDGNQERNFPVASREYAMEANEKPVAGGRRAMVSESRWNQVWGPERIDTATHGSGCNVLLADMTVEFVKTEMLPTLKWSLDRNFVFPKVALPAPKKEGPWKPIALVAIALAVLAPAGAVFLKFRGRATWQLYGLMVVPGGGAGWFFGLMSQGMYRVGHVGTDPGGIAGAIAGLFAGAAYAAFVAAISAGIKRDPDVQLHAMSTGMVTGVICSCAVHGVLMVVTGQVREGMTLVAGMPSGIIVGGVLGVLASYILRPDLVTRKYE
jgi:hypothetical protein